MIYFLVWPLPETAMGLLCICLVGASPYTLHHTITHPTWAESSCSPFKNNLTRPPDVVTANAPPPIKRYPADLAHAVRGVFDSIVANRRHKTKRCPACLALAVRGSVLQRRRQPTPTQPTYIHHQVYIVGGEGEEGGGG